ncbi:MAG TPA: nucleotidyltransferase family protein [Streptosporangiaceae bacterium]|nr:nucleotidyltransferase family protein [Streptosporangiaceae bacterium]
MEQCRHRCPGSAPDAAARLAGMLTSEPWIVRALEVVAASGLPDAWIGAGVIRDVVWGQLYGRFTPDAVRDVDVAYFDSGNLGPESDQAAQDILGELADLPWEATNQAAVHTWYHQYFGGAPVEPLSSVHDAVATWPETATCVAVRKSVEGIEVCAPHGLDDLLGGVWRPNPVRVTAAVSLARLARQRVSVRWPDVTVILPERPA